MIRESWKDAEILPRVCEGGGAENGKEERENGKKAWVGVAVRNTRQGRGWRKEENGGLERRVQARRVAWFTERVQYLLIIIRMEL